MSTQVTLHIANHGAVTLELDEGKAPITVANFLEYVRKGHYNGTVFHRVIPGFMIQGGGFAPSMEQKPTDKEIQNEANNGLKNDQYTIAMARTSAPHSASAQFFINVADTGFPTTNRPPRQAGAMPYLAKLCKAKKWWTRSLASPPEGAACTTMCRRKMS